MYIFLNQTEIILSFCGDPVEDLYVGETISQVITLLGEPSSDIFKVIDWEYTGYEHEPDYSMFYSFDELRKTVTIRVVSWVTENENFTVWGRMIENDWVIFSSLKWGNDIVF